MVAGIGLLAGMTGCGQGSHEFRLATPPLDFDRDVAAELVEVFAQNSSHSITLVPLPASAQSPMDAVESGHADLALASNIQPYRRGITTVMPLYPTVLHVLYRRDREFHDTRSLLQGATVYAGPVDSASRGLMMTVIQSLELSDDDVFLVDEPEVLPDVIGLYLPASPARIAEHLREAGAVGQYQLLSLGTIQDIGTGSSLDRALLLNPRMSPFVLPVGTYGDVTPEPVVTLAVDKMLIARPELDEADIYDLISEIRRLQPALAAIEPLLFRGLSNEFGAADSTFVLHPGAHAFVNRDAPDIYERYSGVAEVLVTLLIGLVSGTFALVQIFHRRRKNRIDRFYVDVISIRDSALKSDITSDRDAAIAQVRELQDSAFEMLVNEKVAADDSFRIFLSLSNDIIRELREN